MQDPGDTEEQRRYFDIESLCIYLENLIESSIFGNVTLCW
jgi:hypothetical protein